MNKKNHKAIMKPSGNDSTQVTSSELEAKNVMHNICKKSAVGDRKYITRSKSTIEHIGKNLRIVADKIHTTNIGEHLGEIGDRVDLKQKIQPFLAAFESNQPQEHQNIYEQ